MVIIHQLINCGDQKSKIENNFRIMKNEILLLYNNYKHHNNKFIFIAMDSLFKKSYKVKWSNI